MKPHDDVPQDQVPALRRGAYTFMRRSAATAWEFQQGPGGWEVFMPPEVQELPAPKRFRTHARQEAQRLADAQLYALCPTATTHATRTGARRRQAATELHGTEDAIDTFGVQPPTSHGFVSWQDPGGVSYGANGAPILACHWGPHRAGGTWIAWWSDNYAVTKGYQADARAEGGTWTSDISVGWLTTVGALFYDDQLILRPRQPGSQHPPANQDPTGPPDAARIGLLHTTVATWDLLSGAGAVQLTRLSARPEQATADRTAGLRPSPITYATTATSGSTSFLAAIATVITRALRGVRTVSADHYPCSRTCSPMR